MENLVIFHPNALFFQHISTVLAKKNVFLQAQILKIFRLRRAVRYISILVMIILARRRRNFLDLGCGTQLIPPLVRGGFKTRGGINSRNPVDN